VNQLWKSVLDTYLELHKILFQDVLEVRTQLESDFQSQLARRNYIRTLFACIEGETFCRKQVALVIYEYWLSSRKTIFTPAEVALLREERYFLDDTGRAKQGELFLKIEDNLRFSLASYGKAYCSLYPKATISQLDCSVKEWKLFKTIIKCRNRITHPKSVCALNITDEEVQDTDAVLLWYSKGVTNLIDKSLIELNTH